jgi:23S rRNA A2030 N6-methylase RlmJ
MIEQNEFLEVVNLLEENYHKKLSDKIIKIWYEELKKENVSKLKKAIIECIKKYPYFPTINQVEENIDTYETVWYGKEIEETPASDEEMKELEERLKRI